MKYLCSLCYCFYFANDPPSPAVRRREFYQIADRQDWEESPSSLELYPLAQRVGLGVIREASEVSYSSDDDELPFTHLYSHKDDIKDDKTGLYALKNLNNNTIFNYIHSQNHLDPDNLPT